MSKPSPTALTIDYMGIRLPTCAEGGDLWNPFAKRRNDLFGCWDVLAIRDGETIAVQTTSRSNVSSRAKKIAEAESTQCTSPGRVEAGNPRVADKGRGKAIVGG